MYLFFISYDMSHSHTLPLTELSTEEKVTSGAAFRLEMPVIKPDVVEAEIGVLRRTLTSAFTRKSVKVRVCREFFCLKQDGREHRKHSQKRILSYNPCISSHYVIVSSTFYRSVHQTCRPLEQTEDIGINFM